MPEQDLDAGLQLHEDGRWDDATDVFNRIIDEEGSEEAEAWIWLAATWEARREPDSAVDAYREALKLDLGDLRPLTQVWLARALLGAGRPADALATVDETDEAGLGDDPALEKLAGSIRRRARRATWALPVRRGTYVTRTELATALAGVLCLVSTFLPWTVVHVKGGDRATGDLGPLNGGWLWSSAPSNAVLVSAAALVVLVTLVQLADRVRLAPWCAAVNVVLSGLAVMGIARVTVLLVVYGKATEDIFRTLDEPALRPGLGYYGGCTLVLAHLILTVIGLVRTFSKRPARTSPPRVR